ncbi:MAG: EcsC family protein [Ginsengibacter sp.]
MNGYEQWAFSELALWQKQMLRRPSFFNEISKKVQTKINNWIPEKVHKAITVAIKQMIKGVLFGASYTTAKPLLDETIEEREKAVLKRIEFYRTTAAVEGGVTGAGGILLGLADFPILLGLKIKLLFDIASFYGHDIKDYKERVYLLHIFELTFSSHENRKSSYLNILDWDAKSKDLPEDINQFDWRNFQQEYRDYIDLAKMAQLLPVIGAPVGVLVNYRLVKKLGYNAMNAYRMRAFENNFKGIVEPKPLKY